MKLRRPYPGIGHRTDRSINSEIAGFLCRGVE